MNFQIVTSLYTGKQFLVNCDNVVEVRQINDGACSLYYNYIDPDGNNSADVKESLVAIISLLEGCG